MSRHGSKRSLAALTWTILALSGCLSLSDQDRGNGDDPPPEALVGAPAPNFRKYRTPIDARVVDRRFYTRDAMYLASEMQLGSFGLFEQALADGVVTSDPDFQYMTTVESYWYSRYNMSALVTESRLGLHVVFGPYVTEWALQEGRSNVNRDRMEYVRANKGHRDRWRHLDLGSRLTEAGREPRTSTPSRSRDSPF
ncbi:MAG: hypothetical protein HY720_09065 [Planctomycetes bacterium]|nr:hypothetical protein [Planctomycetota bacterium]